MDRDPTEVTPAPRRARTYGVLALAGAVMLGVYGIVSRDRGEAKLENWTQAQAIPAVRVITPTPLREMQTLILPGTVQAYYEAPIYARVSGYLKSWKVDIGAHVHRGDVLAQIDAPDLDQKYNQARAALASAEADQKIAALSARRWQALLKTNSVSQQAVDERQATASAGESHVQAAQADLAGLAALEAFKTITAPFDGLVTARNTDIGALIDAGSGQGPQLFRVADLHEMRIYVPVPQSESAQVNRGDRVDVTVPQFPNQIFPARVETSSHAVDTQSRTVLFELLAPNPDAKLLPGSFARVRFHLKPPPGRLQIPSSAILFEEDGAQVAVLNANDTVTLKHVVLGRDDGTQTELLSGIPAGDQLVDSPPDSISNGEHVQVIGPNQVQPQLAGAIRPAQ